MGKSGNEAMGTGSYEAGRWRCATDDVTEGGAQIRRPPVVHRLGLGVVRRLCLACRLTHFPLRDDRSSSLPREIAQKHPANSSQLCCR